MDHEVITINNMELEFTKITIEDKEKVFDLFKECEDFFLLTTGTKPDDCEDYFYNLPPEKTFEDKYLYGVFHNSSLVAAVDIITDYPEKGEWIIGLLLIHPKARGIGLGKKIHNLLKKLAINEGADKLRIGVLEQNTDALVFWNKLGYKEYKITEPRRFGVKESKVVVMKYYL